MSKKKWDKYGPSEAIAADGPVALMDTPAPIPSEVPPAVVLREFVVRFNPPHGDPISYSVRCPTIEDAQATYTLTVTEMNPGPPPAPKPPKWFVEVIAAKTADRQYRRIEIPVYAATAAEALEVAKVDAVTKFAFPQGSITEVKCGDFRWAARVVETPGS